MDKFCNKLLEFKLLDFDKPINYSRNNANLFKKIYLQWILS